MRFIEIISFSLRISTNQAVPDSSEQRYSGRKNDMWSTVEQIYVCWNWKEKKNECKQVQAAVSASICLNGVLRWTRCRIHDQLEVASCSWAWPLTWLVGLLKNICLRGTSKVLLFLAMLEEEGKHLFNLVLHLHSENVSDVLSQPTSLTLRFPPLAISEKPNTTAEIWATEPQTKLILVVRVALQHNTIYIFFYFNISYYFGVSIRALV